MLYSRLGIVIHLVALLRVESGFKLCIILFFCFILGQQYNSFDAEEPDSYMQVNGNLTDVILTPGRSPDTPADLLKQEDLNIAHTLNLIPVIFLIIFRFGSRISLFLYAIFNP